MRCPCYLWVCVFPPHHILIASTYLYETFYLSIYLYIYIYITAPDPILAAYFTNPFHQSVCVYASPPVIAR
jgi:hypothetical protein